ncbi:hypothetical protein EJ02DRAFT_355495 [Clathrospora elynae]|uniref:Uncharacterized protein n=1 Tax=Clathrospora elynae TaxID=706981 RepID=A0A6A5SEL0_9PLEO|nr:hypothetical protein EJ02DRAFT_355495 [Clathrospora elynae]
MFGKRRRAASNPPQRAPPPASASASLAATKAFLQSAESNGELSSAAAAAALRTHVTTPTPVGETVTKRMARRGSVSSNASLSRPPAGALRRQSSSGSMTERSFRAASPGRGSPAEPNAPPVPPVPKNMQSQGSAVHRRASSLEPTYRGGSPNPRGGGRGVSLDRGANSGGRGQRPASHLAQVSEEDDPSRSVNFSRPMSPGAPTTTSHGWFAGPVVNQDAVQRIALTARPKTSSGVEIPRLSTGSMRAKPSAAAVQSKSFLQPATRQPPRPVDPNSPDAIYDPSTRKFIHKQDAMARFRELHEEPEQPTRQYVAQHVDDYHPIPPQHTRHRSPSPARQSVRREEPPAPQRREEPLLPRLDTTKRSEPAERPAATYTPEPRGVGMPRQYSEDSADSDTQHPEQVNTSRKLEDSGYGTVVGGMEDTASPKFVPNQDSAYPRLATPLIPAPANTVAGQGRIQDRHASLSPPRNAHFAPVATELTGAKHDPLPRSSSPAKSALKSSPSVSRRSNSPVAPNGRIYTMGPSSEASETTSDDGRKKKKNIRVSFEETPTISGTSAYADADTPTTQTGLIVSRWSPTADKGDEFEDFMKPRPALPLFGSIRDKERRAPQEDMPEKVTETIPTPMSASMSSNRDLLESSSDNALGNIVAQGLSQKHTPSNDPLPPEVTTVEGSGYVSDSSDDPGMQRPSKHMATLQQPPVPEPKSLSTPHDDRSSAPGSSLSKCVVEVPNIALQPATPSPYERPEPKFQSMMIPGGWDEDFPEPEDQTVNPSPAAPKEVPSAPIVGSTCQQPQPFSDAEDDETDDNSSVYSDACEDLSDREGFGSINALMSSPVAPPSSGLMSSKYANKSVVESSPSKLRQETIADDSTDSDVTPTQGWNAAQRHWSGVNASRKQPQDTALSAERMSHAEEAIFRVVQAPVSQKRSKSAPKFALTPDSTPERKITSVPVSKASTPSTTQSSAKPLKSALKKSPAPQRASLPEPEGQTMRSAAPKESPSSVVHMKKTMRGGPTTSSQAEQQTGSGMRSSMRGGPDTTTRAQPQLRKSMRAADVSSSPNMGLAASRHSMVPMDTKPPRGALQKRNIPPAAAAPKSRPQSMPAARPTAAPVPTYESESDASVSSFQRTRGRGSRDQSGRYTMRGSMRQEPAPTMRANSPVRKQVRAISPPAAPPAIRKSMRPSSPNLEAVKSSKFSIRSLSPMGRFKSSKVPDARPSSPTPQMPSFSKQPKALKQKTPVAKPVKAPKAAFSSRFADSSDDDDDDQPRRFQSRFADSDDEEPVDYKLPPGLTPVRGIPKKAGEEDGDSTDLEEEEDESLQVVPRPASKAGPTMNGTNGNANAQGAALSVGSLRDSKHAPALPSFEAGSKVKTKRGFFGLGKKKAATVQPEQVQTQPGTVESVSAPDEIPMPPSQRNRDMGLRLTPIDEDKDFSNSVPISPQSKKSPKLQRRSTPEWPLPPVPAIPIDERPMSSDGIATRRPRFAVRQSSAISNISAPIVDAQGRSVSYGRTGRKKKFQGLRRVFGLND